MPDKKVEVVGYLDKQTGSLFNPKFVLREGGKLDNRWSSLIPADSEAGWLEKVAKIWDIRAEKIADPGEALAFVKCAHSLRSHAAELRNLK